MANLSNADHDITQMKNIYHRYIDLPFDFIKPDWKDIRRTYSKEQEEEKDMLNEYHDIKEKGDTDVYFCHTPENDEKVTEFLDRFNLFTDSKLLFYTKANDGIKVHIDNNKQEVYSIEENTLENFVDNHVKLNVTWEPKGGRIRWWDLNNKNDLEVHTHTNKGNGKTWSVAWAHQKDCKMVYEKTIDKPSLVNTGRPHSTYNPSKEGRLTLSYTLVKKSNLELLTFPEALWLFDCLLRV